MNYIVKSVCMRNITSFYHHVARKYKHTYSLEMMNKNIDMAYDAMFLIEQTLHRRRPTISRWQKDGWHMAHSGKWYYAYTIDGDTITIQCTNYDL